MRGGHDHALPCGQPVGLHDRRPLQGSQMGNGRIGVGERRRLGRRHAGAPHLLLGEDLRAFELRRSPTRPEDWHARCPQRVGHARAERRLRTDDDQPVAHARRVSRDCRRVQRVELGDGARHGRGAAVSRRDVNPSRRLVTCQAPRQRVFTGAAAQDQDVHAASLGCDEAPRPGRIHSGRALCCGPPGDRSEFTPGARYDASNRRIRTQSARNARTV